MDGDCSSECELEVDCKKGAGFKQTKIIEEVQHISGDGTFFGVCHKIKLWHLA